MPLIPEIPSVWTAAQAIIDDVFGPDDDTPGWFAEFAASYEREHGLEPRELPPFRTMIVRHAGVLRSSDQMPAFVIFPAIEGEPRYDPETGEARADVSVGILIATEAGDDAATGDTLHAYVAIFKQLFEARRTCGGHATDFRRTNVDYRALDVDESGRLVYGADFDYLAKNVLVGRRGYMPPDLQPREDPYDGPLDDLPTVAPDGAHLTINPSED